MSRTTASFSDFDSNPSGVPDHSLPTIAESTDSDLAKDKDNRRLSLTRAFSHGTFGDPVRRWSGSASSAPSGSQHKQSSRPSAVGRVDERPCSDRYDEDSETNSSGRKPRPLSMSSAYASGYSGTAFPQSQALRLPFGTIDAPGHSHSPTFIRPSHRTPYTEQAITADLLRKSAISDIRIVPRSRPTDSNFEYKSGRVPAVTYKTSEGMETRKDRISDDIYRNDSAMNPTACQSQSRKMAKLDQVLGEGAEIARTLMELERRATGNEVSQLSSTS